MKRKIILLVLSILFFALNLNAQSVLGIPFGSSFENTKSSLEKRFGYNVWKDNGNLTIHDVGLGDFKFHFGEFIFQYGNNGSYLSEAIFQRHYDLTESNTAKLERDYLFSLLEEKYEDVYIEEYTNNQGYKCYKFGINPMDREKVLGVII